MGLDMYIEAKKETVVEDKYFSRYMLDDEKLKNDDFSYDPDLSELEKDIFDRNFKSYTKLITEYYQIGYFRKFNALHAYIVNTFTSGRDHCQSIELDKEDLDDIIKVAKEVSENHDLAEKLLPTQSGFFFGGLEYDEWYFKDLEYAIDLFTKARKLLDTGDYKWNIIYHASW